MQTTSRARPPLHFIPFLIGPLTTVLMLAAGPQAGMTLGAWKVASVAVWMALWWVTDVVPITATALLPLILFPLMGIAPMTAAAAPYANPVIFLFLGGFILAAAFEKSGLHRRLALALVARAGTKPDHIVAAFMGTAGFISLWVSNTATVLMLLPLVMSIIDRMRSEGADAVSTNFERALLLGLAYAASIGGLGTLIGTPPNALLAGYMQTTHQVRIPFVSWMIVAVPIVVVALPLTWLWLTRVMFPVRGVELPIGVEVIRAERATLGPMSREEKVVAWVSVITAIAWVLQPVLTRFVSGITDAGISVAAAAVLLLVPITREGVRVLTWAQAERIPWGVLVLFGGGLSLASAIQDSGLSSWMATSLGELRGIPPLALALIVTTIVLFFTELTSNTATAATFLPIVGAVAVAANLNPLTLTAPAALAATCGFMLPVGTPPNALVFGTGRLTTPLMARAGFPINLLLIVLITLATWFLMPSVLDT